MSDDVNIELKKFGRYLILDHLVDGGMAKICRARFISEQADKIVAIKMIQPQYSRNTNFKTMFLNEIKVTFGLIHPNIAQTYDYGDLQGQLFTTMEYVDGANLKQFLVRLKETNFSFPIELSVYVISQVCQGLFYAHNFSDKLTGKAIHIIHRDISPHNIMINYDGAVKIIDFGIAKAETNSEVTQAGTIKGKLSYLAPEYLEGMTLDPRYDQFGVGATLWELLCGTKLFSATNDLAVLKLIQKCHVPAPSTINPKIPKELDEIVLKSLSKNRDDRFADMEQMSRALVKFLYANYPNFNSSDLAYFSKKLFKEDIEKDQIKMREFGKINMTPYLTQYKNESQGRGQNAVEKTQTNIRDRTRREIDFDIKDAPALTVGKKTEQRGTGIHNIGEKTGTSTRVRYTKTDLKKEALLDSQEKKSSWGIILVVVLVAALAFSQKQKIKKIFKSSKESPALSVEESNIGKGLLFITGFDPYMELFIDGKSVSYSTAGLAVPLEGVHILSVEKNAHRPFKQEFSFAQGQSSFNIEIPKLEEIKYGELSTSSNYLEGSLISFEVFGEKVEKELPLKQLRLPVGKYDAIIINPILHTEKKVSFDIEENKNFNLP
ncbi:MAG: serine/threonine protein kinase [Bacteriovoracaceae bacterium]|nr:serine/threonine protein kinase [Bacteriovoracaceae bacterium]